MQNYFEKSKFGKTIPRNFSERVIFPSRGGKWLLKLISSQIFPNQPRFLEDVATWINKYTPEEKYFLIDESAMSTLPSNMIVRTSIFPKVDGDANTARPIFFFPN